MRQIIVAKSGVEFTTIRQALDSIPKDNREWVEILLKPGVYHELLEIETPYIRIVGEDAKKTVITYNNGAATILPDGTRRGTFRSYAVFVGTHDFRAVRSVGTETRSTVRTIYWCNVERNGDLLELKVCANGFLYNMVRAITGTVLYAAEGKFLPEDIPAILESGDRTAAGPTVPPGGLYLTRLWYEDERLNER